MSRPRRFGKSLLLSTFRAYWEGKNCSKGSGIDVFH
ncbi:MAG: AAA family ATPase [Ruminococcus sp.]|nr:AAA family ATPase [Ruminococcus sp.]